MVNALYNLGEEPELKREDQNKPGAESAPVRAGEEIKQLADLSPKMMQFLLRLNSWVPPGDLTTQQFRTLRTLGQSKKALTMTELSKTMGVSQSTLSETVKRLSTQGYISRQRLPEDDRVVSISLTRKGKLATKQARTRLLAAYRKLCESMDEATRKRFIESHEFILGVLRTIEDQDLPQDE